MLHADTLTYDALGHIRANTHTGETAQYDTLGHLTSATFLSGNNEHYTYDALGNRVTATTPGGADIHSDYHYVGGTNELDWVLHPPPERSSRTRATPRPSRTAPWARTSTFTPTWSAPAPPK